MALTIMAPTIMALTAFRSDAATPLARIPITAHSDRPYREYIAMFEHPAEPIQPRFSATICRPFWGAVIVPDSSFSDIPNGQVPGSRPAPLDAIRLRGIQ
jgi:hypothetical protein